MGYPTLFSEQVNSPPTELSAAIDAAQLTIAVVDGSLLPDGPCPLTIGSDVDAETVLMTSKTGNTLTVIRGFEGVARAWPIGEAVGRNFTAYDHEALIEWVQTNKSTTETAQGTANNALAKANEIAPKTKALSIPVGAWSTIADGYRAVISDPDVTDNMYLYIAFDRVSLRDIKAAICDAGVYNGSFALETDKLPTVNLTGNMTLQVVEQR